MSINEFFENHKNYWNYFLAYVNLLADICIDRNINSIESVSQILSLQAVAVILADSSMTQVNQKVKDNNTEKVFPIENLHEPFIRIAHHVYVDNHKFHEIKRIGRIS